MFSTSQDPIRLNCELCGIKDVHKNDFHNHLQSRKHRGNVRKQNKAPNDVLYECLCCKVRLTDKELYEIHVSGRGHRRKLKKLGIKEGHLATPENEESVFQPPTALLSKIDGRSFSTRNLSLPQPDFVREKYKTRSSTTENEYCKSYMTSVAAFLSLKLALDQTVQDFFISIKDKEWHSFGDIVVKVIHGGKVTLYAIKCKQVSSTFKQVSSLNEAKVIMDKEFVALQMLRRNPDFRSACFTIFTTLGTTSAFCKSVPLSHDVLDKWKTAEEEISAGASLSVRSLKRSSFVNLTSDPENIYSFTLSSDVKAVEESVSLPAVLFCVNQRVGPHQLDKLLRKRFEDKDIEREYTRYIEDWAEGKLGGDYKLRKKDVILKVGQILLSPYVISPKLIKLKQESFDVWNHVLNFADLTVVRNEPFVISKISQPINVIIEKTLGIQIDTISRTINLKGKIDSSTEPVLKAYLFEEIDDLSKDIDLTQMHMVFWKSGKTPLLLSSENDEAAKGFILDVIAFMKQYGVERKFLLKTSQPNVVRAREKLRIFTCLDDVKDLVDLKSVNIKISDTFKLSFQEIAATDPFVLKWVTPAMFFDAVLEKYILRPDQSKNGGLQNDLKIILSDELREFIYLNLYKTTDRSREYSVGRLKEIDPRLF